MQQGNTDQLDTVDAQSLDDEPQNVIQFAPVGKGTNLKKSVDSKAKQSKKTPSGAQNISLGGQYKGTTAGVNKTAEKGKKTTSLTAAENRGDGKRSKSRGHHQDNQKEAS